MQRHLTVLFVALTLVAGARADDVADVTAAITALNQAFEKGDSTALKALMTPDKIAVTEYYGGPMAREQQIKSLPDLKLTEYRAGKMTIQMLGKEAALVTYPLQTKGTFKGKPLAPRNFASAVWVKRNGKWLEKFYQETVLGRK